MTSTLRVCPRCGEAAKESEYCQTCGLHLWAESELPTRADWERDQFETASPSSGVSAWWTRRIRGFKVATPFVGAALVLLTAITFSSLNETDPDVLADSLEKSYEVPPAIENNLDYYSLAPGSATWSCHEAEGNYELSGPIGRGADFTCFRHTEGNVRSDEFVYAVSVEGDCWTAKLHDFGLSLGTNDYVGVTLEPSEEFDAGNTYDGCI